MYCVSFHHFDDVSWKLLTTFISRKPTQGYGHGCLMKKCVFVKIWMDTNEIGYHQSFICVVRPKASYKRNWRGRQQNFKCQFNWKCNLLYIRCHVTLNYRAQPALLILIIVCTLNDIKSIELIRYLYFFVLSLYIKLLRRIRVTLYVTLEFVLLNGLFIISSSFFPSFIDCVSF